MTTTSDKHEYSDHDPRFIAALGRLTIDFGALEEHLHEGIWHILGGNEERAQIMTAGLAFQVLVEKWAALYAQKFDHLVLPEPAAQLRTRLLSINERRNRYVHSLWALDVGTGQAIRERRRAKAGIGIDWEVQDVTLDEIEQLLSDIHEVMPIVIELTTIADGAFKVIGPRRKRH